VSQHDQGFEDYPRPWWIWKTWRWGGATTVGPFWRLEHWVNIWTQIRGHWWRIRGY